MKNLIIALLLAAASPAFAHCPDAVTCEMKAIDSTLANSVVNAEVADKVKSMRAEGQKLYDDGRTQEALSLLKEARKLLKSAS